ncbi:uncharacterized protein KZ484_007115 isoform 1-T4 [Pholidichthys leucotaenia]
MATGLSQKGLLRVKVTKWSSHTTQFRLKLFVCALFLLRSSDKVSWKSTPWSNEEVQSFLCLVADSIQSNLQQNRQPRIQPDYGEAEDESERTIVGKRKGKAATPQQTLPLWKARGKRSTPNQTLPHYLQRCRLKIW